MVFALSTLRAALAIKISSYVQNKITYIITLPDDKTGRGKEQPDARQELCFCIDGSAQIFRDNGELKKAYESQKDSLADMANSP